MFSLFPREDDFFVLFRRQASLVRRGCDQLHEMMTSFDRLEQRARELKETEHEGDVVTHELFARLNKTFITPIEREDIHNLASGLDDVLDSVEAIAARLVLYKIPHSTPPGLALTEIVAKSGVQIEGAVGRLRGLKNLESFTVEINRLENEADDISRRAVADLFSGGHELLDILRWKEIYGRLENAADQCEDVANTIESIVLKNL